MFQCFLMFYFYLQNHYERICSFFPLSSLTITQYGSKTCLICQNVWMLLAIEWSQLRTFIIGGTPRDFAILLSTKPRIEGLVYSPLFMVKSLNCKHKGRMIYVRPCSYFSSKINAMF
jgi:hypothetical protein